MKLPIYKSRVRGTFDMPVMKPVGDCANRNEFRATLHLFHNILSFVTLYYKCRSGLLPEV
jgi:hypothetical protein